MEDPKGARPGREPEPQPAGAEEGRPSPRARERMADSRLAQAGSDRGPERPPPSEPARPEPPRPSPGTRVAVCDEGELEDVMELLRDLDQSPLRLRPADLDSLEEWERPSQLLVTTLRIALTQTLPLPRAAGGGVAIAVADGAATAPCSAVLRRGFGYVVRRPVHPAALRLLLAQVLWRGRENRDVARFPFGARVRWRSGLRRGSGTMLEVSAHGCRLAGGERLAVGDRIRLRVPAALTRSRDLRLRGRVLRRDREDTGEGGAPEIRLAVRFERLSSRSRAHLDALLAEHASGPAMSADAAQPPAARPRPSPAPGEDSCSPPWEQAAPARPAAQVPEVERRRRRRGVWHEEVVALERQSDRVLLPLLGSDLSVGGVRVEPNPLLRLGDRLRVALYQPQRSEPLVLDARVAHDDGRRGVGLVFVDASEEQQAGLLAMVDALPPISVLDDGDEKPREVVLGQIVLRSPAQRLAADAEPADGEAQHDDRAAQHHDDEA